MRLLCTRSGSGAFRSGFAAALVGAALLLAPGGAIPEAGARPSSARSDMQAGPGAGDQDVSGRIQYKHGRRGDRVKLRLRNLEPRTNYDVRDGVTRSLLASVRSNRRGKANASFLSEQLSGGDAVGLAGLPIEVCIEGTDEPVLEGRVPGDKEDGGGYSWTDFTYRVGTVGTEPDAEVSVSITLSSVSGEGLETSMDSMTLQVGTPWLWVGEDGGNGGDRKEPAIAGPVTFWIADGEGKLREVASLDGCKDGDDGQDGEDGDDGHDGGDGHDGNDGGGRNHDGTGVAMLVRNDGTTGGDPGVPSDCPADFYFWYADNSWDPGLPLRAETVDDLVGRAFEVRDGEGNVLLAGNLPELEEIVFEDPWKDFTYETGTVATEPDAEVQAAITVTSWSDGTDEGTYDSISLTVGSGWYWIMDGGISVGDFEEIPGPVTLWIADGEGELHEVAVIEAQDWGCPIPLMGANWTGADGGPRNDYPDGGDGQWHGGDDCPEMPSFFSWYADNQSGDGLPFGVSRVKELSGRAFEVRDGEGNVLFSGALPELEAVDAGNGGGVVFPDGSMMDGVK